MTAKRCDLNVDDAVELYGSGLTIAETAARMKTHRRYVFEALKARGITRSASDASKLLWATHEHPRRLDLPTATIAQRYLAGESIKRIGKSFGVSQSCITRCLREQGVALRSCAETFGLTTRVRVEQGAALGTEQRIGWGEDVLRGWLADRGESPEAQLCLGVKNLDIAIRPIAVEVLLSSSSPLAVAEYRERVEYLADRGWTTCYVLVSRRTRTLLPSVADQLIAKAKLIRTNPTAPREHWVIRGCGEIAARFGDKPKDRPLVRPAKNCPHHATGNPRRSE